MAIFKRFEVWLLLVLSIAGVGYVLWSENQPDPDEGTDPIAPDPEKTEDKKRFKIREVRTVAEGANQVIEVELLGRNDTDQPEELILSEIRLLAKYEGDEEESELPSFFLPFDPPPTLAPKSESIVILKYWLESKTGMPNPLLRLEIDSESLKVRLPEIQAFSDSGGKFSSGQDYQF